MRHKYRSVLGNKLLDRLAGALASAVLLGIGYVLVYLGEPVMLVVATESSKSFLLRLAGLLVFVLVVCAWYIFELRAQISRPLTEKYPFDSLGGFYKDPATGRCLCARCLSENKVVHLQEHGDARLCNACGKGYRWMKS